MYRTAAVLALVLAIAGPLDAQTADTERWRDPAWRATAYLSEIFAAVTVCEHKPVVWVRADLAPADTGWIGVHERDHVELMLAFPSCEAFYAWRFADPEHAVEVEARAFCASAKYDHARNRYGGWIETLWAYGSILGGYVWLGMHGPADGMKALARYCVGPPP